MTVGVANLACRAELGSDAGLGYTNAAVGGDVASQIARYSLLELRRACFLQGSHQFEDAPRKRAEDEVAKTGFVSQQPA